MREMGVTRSNRIVMLSTSEDSHLLERAQRMQTLMAAMFYLRFYIVNMARKSAHFVQILIKAGTKPLKRNRCPHLYSDK